MQIALTADPELPVPPIHYGGIERIIDMLAKGLVELGHEVTLFAHSQSNSGGRLVSWPGASSLSRADTLRNASTLASHIARGKFDIVHSFSRIAYLSPILPLRLPKLMTYQRPISRRSVQLAHLLSRGTLQFTAISRFMMEDVADIGTWHLVYNGVPLSSYDFKAEVATDAPLVFLGRVEEIKGPHLAIEVAHQTKLPLIIAGNIPEAHRNWYEQNVVPHVDGNHIKYIGPVDDRQKNELLGKARAFLMPILWDEPFGIVMAEAMACGTPVIGMNRGSVPEVVEDGVTGYVVLDVAQMVNAVQRIGSISRRAVRNRAKEYFSSEAVVEGYLSIYRSIAGAKKK